MIKDIELVKLKCRALDEKTAQQTKNINQLKQYLAEREQVLKNQKRQLAMIKMKVICYETINNKGS